MKKDKPTKRSTKEEKLWVAPGHFYSPISSTAEIKKEEESIFNRKVRKLPGIDLRVKKQIQFFKKISRQYNNIPFKHNATSSLRFYYNNDQFSYPDAIILFCIIKTQKPKRIIEIGSGFSTALMLDINEKYFHNSIKLYSVEPYPERLLSMIRSNDPIKIIQKKVQKVDTAFFKKLESNDILFIDSTHVVKTGSDVNKIVFEILPKIQRGVYIHFHDVQYPFEYLKSWVYQGRSWNEAYFLRAFLQYNKSFQIILFNSYIGYHHRELINNLMPLMLKRSQEGSINNSDNSTGGSIWLRRM